MTLRRNQLDAKRQRKDHALSISQTQTPEPSVPALKNDCTQSIKTITQALDRGLLLQIGHSIARQLWLEINSSRQRNADGRSLATALANSTGFLPDPLKGKWNITVKTRAVPYEKT